MKGLLATAFVIYALGVATFVTPYLIRYWGRNDIVPAMASGIERGLAWPVYIWTWLT